MSERRADEKAKREAKNLKKLEDIRRIRNKESNFLEVVELYHHLS
jgi:hypothetical protein